MKRAAVNSKQSLFVGEDASVRLKQQRLLEDYLEVQKEFVCKKKRLQMAKQKREVLLAEVSFLRQRHNYLKVGSLELEAKQGLVRPENSSVQSKLIGKNGNRGVDEASPNNLPPVLVAHTNLGNEDRDSEKKAEDVLNPLRTKKKRTQSLRKELGRRKFNGKIKWL